MKKIESKIYFEDSRGLIIDLIENKNINAVTYISFTKGAIRGNHYHKHTTQWNYLLAGSVKLISKNAGSDEVIEFVMKPGDLVFTEPMEAHALLGIENSELLVFTQGPRGGKEYESDTFHLDIPLVS